MTENYAGEPIPEPSTLVTEADTICRELPGYSRYSWGALYEPRLERKGSYTVWYQRDVPHWVEKGLYVLYDEAENPVYVGNSRNIPRRLRNHFLGKSHTQASLVYLMLRDVYDTDPAHHDIYLGQREDLPNFDALREAQQATMRDTWSIRMIPMQDGYQRHFTECYLACALQSKWNSFQTH